MKYFIITGGSGFIGTHLLNDLKSESNIVVIDIAEPKFISKCITYGEVDIREQIRIDIKSNNSIIYHLAALCKEPGYSWDEYFETNYLGTKNIIEFAERNNINNIIYTSTEMVFRAGERRYSEEDLTAPDTAYGMSKLLGELLLLEWAAKLPKRRLRIVRPGVVFGKGENGNYTRLYYALKKGYFTYIGKNDTVKSSIYVKDLVRFLRWLETDNHNRIIYNFVYPEPTTIKEIVYTMCDVFNMKRFVPIVPYSLALGASYALELLSQIGLQNGFHHRRIQKLYHSTNIAADEAYKNGFKLKYSLREAIEDWRNDCLPDDLY